MYLITVKESKKSYKNWLKFHSANLHYGVILSGKDKGKECTWQGADSNNGLIYNVKLTDIKTEWNSKKVLKRNKMQQRKIKINFHHNKIISRKNYEKIADKLVDNKEPFQTTIINNKFPSKKILISSLNNLFNKSKLKSSINQNQVKMYSSYFESNHKYYTIISFLPRRNLSYQILFKLSIIPYSIFSLSLSNYYYHIHGFLKNKFTLNVTLRLLIFADSLSILYHKISWIKNLDSDAVIFSDEIPRELKTFFSSKNGDRKGHYIFPSNLKKLL